MMKIEELENNNYKRLETGDLIYAPNMEIAIKRFKAKDKQKALNEIENVKQLLWNKGEPVILNYIEEIEKLVKNL